MSFEEAFAHAALTLNPTDTIHFHMGEEGVSLLVQGDLGGVIRLRFSGPQEAFDLVTDNNPTVSNLRRLIADGMNRA